MIEFSALEPLPFPGIIPCPEVVDPGKHLSGIGLTVGDFTFSLDTLPFRLLWQQVSVTQYIYQIDDPVHLCGIIYDTALDVLDNTLIVSKYHCRGISVVCTIRPRLAVADTGGICPACVFALTIAEGKIGILFCELFHVYPICITGIDTADVCMFGG